MSDNLDYNGAVEHIEFEINTDILTQQNNTTTDLGDIYGFSVFSGDFGKAVEREKSLKEQEINDHFNYVLVNDTDNIVDRSFHMVMTGEAKVIVKNENRPDLSGNQFASATIGLLIGVIFATGIWLLIERKRKEKSSRENNNYNYRTE